VNFLIPGTTPAGDVTVNINGAETRATVAAAAPAVFTFDGRAAATRGTGLRGEPLEIYATGLGRPIAETSVTIGGLICRKQAFKKSISMAC
jgi:hypothetical protein